MAEYIERKAAYPLAKKICDAIDKVPRCILGHDILDFIDDIPAADVRPVVRGKWINQRADSEMCSACGVRFYISALFAVGGNDEPNFCPNCGAMMEES